MNVPTLSIYSVYLNVCWQQLDIYIIYIHLCIPLILVYRPEHKNTCVPKPSPTFEPLKQLCIMIIDKQCYIVTIFIFLNVCMFLICC